MKKIIFSTILFVSTIANAQVGINTSVANATLEIKAKTDGSTSPEGVIIPKLTSAQISAMPVGTNHAGMMVYNTTEECIQVYQAQQWKCLGTGAGSGLAAFLNATYAGSTGTWVQDYTANGNTISFNVANNSSMSFSNLNFNNALNLTNANAGLSYTPSTDYSNISIPSGSSQVFVYNIAGTPTSFGTLTANFNASGGVSAYGNIDIAKASGITATNITFSGNYVSNAQLVPTTHTVSLTIRNFTQNAVSNLNLSNAIALSGASGISIVPNQNTNVSIAAGQEVTLSYQLQGIASTPGTLTASFTPHPQVSGTATASQQIPLFSNVAASNLSINGSYVYGQNMNTNNTITVQVSNNNAFALNQIDFSGAVSISGAVNNLSVAAGQNTSVNIPANSQVSLTYNLTGTSMVQAGGTLTATFAQTPFTTLTATATVIGNNGFYATPNSITLPKTGGNYTFQITSGQAWNYSLDANAQGWVTVSSTTGTSGNGSITVQTTPKTSSQGPQVGYLNITQPSTGATIQIAINQEPTDVFEITGFTSQTTNFAFANNNFQYLGDYYVSIHNGKTSTMSTNQSNLQVYGDLPSFVESVSIQGNQIVLTPKERTESGLPTSGTIRFSYGGGYLSPVITIYQNQKAYKCPANPFFSANQGYKIWNSSQYFDGATVFNPLIETRNGVDNFDDYNFSSIYGFEDFYSSTYNNKKEVVQNSNQSTLFAKLENADEYGIVGAFNAKDFVTWENSVYYKFGFMFRNDKTISFMVGSSNSLNRFSSYIPDLSNSVLITPLVCADGYDEDTPNVTGNAGWRQ